MRTIVALLLRQLTLMVLSFLFMYFFVLFFGANPDYFEWSDDNQIAFGLAVFTASVLLHTYWYHIKEQQ
jgi:hypothetical protein